MILGGWIEYQIHGVTKGVDEMIDEGVFQWFGHVKRMEKEMIGKRVYVGDNKERFGCQASKENGGGL